MTQRSRSATRRGDYSDVPAGRGQTHTDIGGYQPNLESRHKPQTTAPLALTTDFARREQRRYSTARITALLPRATLDALASLADKRAASLSLALLAAFKTLLARYSGQDDIAVSTPERTDEGMKARVLRTDLGGDPSFIELLQRMRATTLDARPALARDELNLRRASPTAPASVRFAMLDATSSPADDRFESGQNAFDLSLGVDSGHGGCVELEYAADLFRPDTARRLLNHYLALLDQIVADPHRPVSRLQLLTDAEWRTLVHDWNATAKPFPSKRSDELIAAQARRSPARVAVSGGGQTLTYAQLEARANQLAYYLTRRGVGVNALVGICLERSIDMVVALLAVMKSGAAYVPLDPAFPRERLAFMVEDSGLAFVLTDSRLAEAEWLSPERRLDLDRLEAEIARATASKSWSSTTPDDLAYVLYTSGSTGMPKGVEIPHRALSNFLWAMRERPGCGAEDTLLAVTTLSFDIAGLELLLPLVVGGRVEIATRAEASDGRALMQRMAACRPTLMQATPATWRMLFSTGWKGDAKLVALCGGETLPADLAAQLVASCAALWNLYGPTETTIWSTLERIGSGAAPISIGRPIANTTVYLLDRNLQPVPLGVPGELFIGGAGLARGYRNRPALTAERFIPDPFSTEPDARLYRTGDLARYLPDGRIVHLGRLDFQVKIRGFRIELAEVEAVLARHPAVAQCVVAAKDDRQGLKQLVAYVRRRPGSNAQAAELRAHVRASLPDYMTPARVVFVAEFPLTPNHKIDVKALPEPAPERAEHAANAAAEPQRNTAVQLIALWRSVLGDESVGMDDDFFDHGGDSLKAVELLTMIEHVYGRKLPLATLFEAPTIARMERILAAESPAPWRALVAIAVGGPKPPLFLVPGVGGNVLVFAQIAALLGAEHPVYGLQPRGLDGVGAPFTSIDEMAAHYVAEIRSVQPHGPYWIGGACTGAVVAYEMARQLRAGGERVALALMDPWYPTSRQAQPTADRANIVRYLTAKLRGYAGELRQLPVRQWPAFLQSKLHAAMPLIQGDVKTALTSSDYFPQRVMQATFNAVAAYKPAPSTVRLLNVLASEREIEPGARDTRPMWTGLGAAGSRTVFIAAQDSGRLFVAPHVEALADCLKRHAAEELDF